MNLADIGRLIIPPREAENIPNPDKQPMQLAEMDLSRPNGPPPRGYPNPDAASNPYGPPPDPVDTHGMLQPLELKLPPPNYKREHLAAAGGAAPGTPPDPSQLSDPMQDPGFRAFIAQKARDLDELRAAQQASNEARNSFGMRAGNALITAGMVGGIGADPSQMLKQRYEQAGQPVADVLSRQKAAGELTKNASADVGLSGEMMKNRIEGEENNPNSPLSMAMLRAAGLRPDLFPGVSGSMVPTAQRGQQIAVEQKKAATEQKKVEQPEMEVDAFGRQYNRKGPPGFVGDAIGGKELPANVEKEVSSLISGARGLDDLEAQREGTGVLGDVADRLGFGDYHGVKAGVASEVAKADSRGNANPAMAGRLESTLPSPKTPGAGMEISTRKKALLQQAEARVRELENGMYNPRQVATLRADLEAAKANGPKGSTPAGGGMVDVISPEGKAGSVPADKLDAALKKGFRRAGN